MKFFCFLLTVFSWCLVTKAYAYCSLNIVTPPEISRATKLPNKIYQWRNHQVRYQVAHPPDSVPSKGSAVLVHGLFVNSDHWRHTLKGLAEAGYTAYALDLLGSGYSAKPSPSCPKSRELVCGEVRRFRGEEEGEGFKRNIILGTSSGGSRVVAEIDLRHPCNSPYNFYTWSEQVADFTKDIVMPAQQKLMQDDDSRVTLVANSIGSITSLQSVLDHPDFYNGVFVVNPNFRELHSSEVPIPRLSMPVIRLTQSLLRSRGKSLFDVLAKPNTVKAILKEPYFVREAIDDELVDVLLTPLLTPGAAEVVFDTLSYSAGPLPEQQLRDESFPKDKVPVWILYGDKDPWTPGARVEKMGDLDSVERVIRLANVGHCPHDEAPELVNPLLVEFMERVRKG